MTLLGELSACGPPGHELVVRTRLPHWCRAALFFFLSYIAKSEGREPRKALSLPNSLIKGPETVPAPASQGPFGHFRKGQAADHIPGMKALGLRLTHRLWPFSALRVAICLCHAAPVAGPPGRKPGAIRCEDAIVYQDRAAHSGSSDAFLESLRPARCGSTEPEAQPRPSQPL